MRPNSEKTPELMAIIQRLQSHIVGLSSLGQGYVHITFHTAAWTWGTVTARLTESGAPEWEGHLWRNTSELIELLQYIRDEAKSRGYTNVVCPACNNDCYGDVTLEDHGVCWDCHKELLNGERCYCCLEAGHILEDCGLND
jgi:hypothetical protein